MAWRTVAALFIVVFALVLVWSVTAGPLTTIQEDMQDLDDTSGDELDADEIFPGLTGTYFSAILFLVFGLIAWAFWVVFREEITQQGGGRL